MNWAGAASFDHIFRSPSFPMWLTLVVAGFFALIVLVTILRAERSVANGALAVITLLAIGIAAVSMLRRHEPAARSASAETRSSPAAMYVLPAMACIEDIAGDAVGQACEKVLFSSAESTAAAVSYASSMVSRLTSLGDAAAAQKTMGPELQAMRRAIERDRYGLVAQVLMARDRCTPTQCPAYRSLTDNHQIITNMDEHTFDTLVARYAPSWNALPGTVASGPMAMLPASVPTGRPTNAEFPSAANTPPVSIMSPEPGTGAKAPPAASQAPAHSAQAAASQAPTRPAQAAASAAAAKKGTKRAPIGGPTLLSPGPQAPAASND
ncbi:MAG TPA: hypothetical protein VKR55_32285 [Bradyrhizobium sp.]|uniref:hypothetical protein n=1 Tax=Bradyrhizobium sp. TaxID=376 RepID=UPI002B88C710|nr:hypothetical protein [Bradyrhizobium sp.]HLZ06812.1 hypothetical protein [Bradyrhizobium sp.]